ncbi:MAG: transglycosylase domain-containing protein [Actinomycetota bacterium]
MAVQTSPPRNPAPRRGKHAASRKTRRKTRARGRRGFFRRYWWVFVAVPLSGILALFGALWFAYSQIELPEAAPPLQTSYVYDEAGDLITTLHEEQDRTIIPLKQMPQSLREAVVATEDQDFYSHSGFDPIGIARAAWKDIVLREAVQGGSTITQQLVKNVYAGTTVEKANGQTVYRIPDRTPEQKVREVLLAIKLEQEMGKDEILATYLNTIYFGDGAYGVEAAAQTYWDKPAEELSSLQSIQLAGMIASPERFDPRESVKEAAARRDYVIGRMVSEGYLTQAEASKLRTKKLTTAKASKQPAYPQPWFIDYVKRYLTNDAGFSGQELYGGGYQITTTLDRDMQTAAADAIESNLPSDKDPQAALVAIEPSTGEVRAFVGGRSYKEFQLGPAPGLGGFGRSPGSTFKAVVLASALDNRISLNSSWNGPSTINIPDEACYTDGGPWQPSNAGDSTAGTMSLASATKYSVNTIFAQVGLEVGLDKVADMARALGIRDSKVGEQCALSLGAVEVTPMEMTSVYATFAGRGVYRAPSPIIEVRDPAGKVLWGGKKQPETRRRLAGERVLSANDAALVSYALQGVVEDGTGTAAALFDRPVAGKTGTAQGYKDAWFCGYTPQLATCVWVGYPETEKPLYNIEGYSEVYGGTIPANIWREFMVEALEGAPVREFPEPDFGGYGSPDTSIPTTEPTQEPNEEPTDEPTEEPTDEPTDEPTEEPTDEPTEEPTDEPRLAPERRRARWANDPARGFRGSGGAKAF